MRWLQASGLALALIWSALAQAALTKAEVEKFITATDAVMRYGEENLKELPQGEDSFDFTNWSQSMMTVVKDSGHADQISGLVKDAGFSSLQQWADTSEQVMMAMFAGLMAEQGPVMEAGLAMLEAMIANPKLEAADKAKLQEQLTSARQALNRANEVPKADVDVVKPYLPRLQQLFDGVDPEEAAKAAAAADEAAGQ